MAAGDWVLGSHTPRVLAVTEETEGTQVLANKGVALGGMLGTLGQGDCLGSGRVPHSWCARVTKLSHQLVTFLRKVTAFSDSWDFFDIYYPLFFKNIFIYLKYIY